VDTSSTIAERLKRRKRFISNLRLAVVAMVLAGSAVATYIVISGMHETRNPKKVEHSARHFFDINMPADWNWYSSARDDDQRDITMRMQHPYQLVVFMRNHPATECQTNKEFLAQSMRDELGANFEQPTHEFTRKVAGEEMLFTTDTGRKSHILIGALVTSDHDGIFLKAEEVVPNDREKEIAAVEQLLQNVSAWH
jgi:hypothetical protein